MWRWTDLKNRLGQGCIVAEVAIRARSLPEGIPAHGISTHCGQQAPPHDTNKIRGWQYNVKRSSFSIKQTYGNTTFAVKACGGSKNET